MERNKKTPSFFPAVIKPMKQELTENRFEQYFFFYCNCYKNKAIAGSANENSEKSYIYLNTYRAGAGGRGGKQTKENPNSDIY